MKAAIVMNKSAGSACSDEEMIKRLRALFNNLEIEADVFLPEAKDVKDAVKSLIPREYDVIVGAGGDGTLNYYQGNENEQINA